VEVSSKEFFRTRTTLINRLKDWRDQESWQEFFDTYWKLIYSVARKSGLTSAEAQDVVQETMFSTAKHLPNFQYDRKKGSFRAWLLTMTRWRIADQLRQRSLVSGLRSPSKDALDPSASVPLESVPDRADLDVDAIWDEEWKKNLINVAMAKVKRDVNPQHFQVFDLYVNKEWAPDQIAKAFGIAVGAVYMAKNRISGVIKKEVQRLEREMA